jgi:hypothetical protein
MNIGISEKTKTDVDYFEGLANYLTLQLVQAGVDDIQSDKKLTLDILKSALETINKELEKEPETPPVPIKVTSNLD